MRAGLAALIAACVLLAAARALPLRAQSPASASQVPVSNAVFSHDVYPQVRAAFPGGVVGLPNLTYGSISGFRALKLDLYVPPGPVAGARPAIVYMHGGGWTGGTPRTTGAFSNWPEVLASFAARGYVVASIQYRLSGEAPFPAAIQDVKNAIRWLRANAKTYGIDTQRFVTWGVSAGGQLAGLAAVSCGVAELEPPAATGRRGGAAALDAPPAVPPSDCVQGAVLWYAASNLEMPDRGAATAAGPRGRGGPNAYLGCTPPNCTAQAHAATVNTYVDDKDPPMLLIHGSADTTVPVAESQMLYDLLKSKGVRSELLVLPDISHSFIGKTPDATRDASRKALQKTIEFIDAITKASS